MLIYFCIIKNLIYKGDYICSKVAADVLGLSDVGSVITPKDYDKVDADDYVMHEDGENLFSN